MTIKQLALAGGNQEKDPYFNNVSLLLHGDGNNGGQNNEFKDSSGNNLAITRNGNVTQGTFSPFSAEPGKWSNYFDGNGDYLTVPSNNIFAFGTGNFTIEMWIIQNVNVGGVNYECLFSNRGTDASSIYLGISPTGCLVYWRGGVQILDSTALTLGTLYHVALVRNGNNIILYKNGVSVGSVVDTTNIVGNNCYIAQEYGLLSAYFNGIISNLRIITGIAVYTGNFTPPSKAPLATSGAASIAAYPSTTNVNTTFASSACSLLTCQDNRFKDNSLNNFTLTPYGDVKVTPTSPFAPSLAYNPSVHGGSAYSYSNNNYLALPTSSALNCGTGDFCFEGWFYQLVPYTAGDYTLVFTLGNTWQITVNGSAGAYLWNNGYAISTGSVPVINSWHHIVWCRSGSTMALYVDGVRAGTYTSSATVDLSTGYIGNYTANPGAYNWKAYLSGISLTKGNSIYNVANSNITIPTVPPTNTANTSLLCNFTNANIIDSSRKNDLETVGNAQVSTTTKKFGAGAMYFDGSGDYLTRPNSDLNNLGTGDFTIELWFKSNTGSMNTHACLVGSYSSPVSGSWAFKAQSGTTGFIEFTSYGPSWNDWVTSTNIASDQQWHHCAVARNGTMLRIFVDGLVVGSWTLGSIDALSGGNHPLTVGFMAQDSTSYLNGYIDDLRITKGIARYTANFIPPTRSLPNQ